MGAYQQMGHQSHNLLLEPELSTFAGGVLSPVNYGEHELRGIVDSLRFRRGFDIIFDPQLYVPRSQRQSLHEWSYFPKDVDSADLASDEWWANSVREVVNAASRMRADAICSPAQLPKAFTDDYFAHLVQIGSEMARHVQGGDLRPMQSAIVALADLASSERALTISSILSSTACREIYLVFVGPEVTPRRELADADEIRGAMTLISTLQASGLSVFVAFASSDIVLWKAAGATHCATGKFFNLRRFTRSRFQEPPAKGGGAQTYWFEESLLAFIRESDQARLLARDLLSEASQRNPFGRQIIEQQQTSPGGAWLGLGWRQYLWWFADIERRIDEQSCDVHELLKAAEEKWLELEHLSPPLLMDEAANNGSWVRPWRRALVEYRY